MEVKASNPKLDQVGQTASVVHAFSRLTGIIGRSSELFLESLTTNYPRKTLFAGIVLFTITLTVYVRMSPAALINGDAAVYVQLIEALDFSQITVHIGYYASGVLFIHLLPVSNDYALNLMNCFYGALTVSVVYFIAFTLSGRHASAIVSALCLATSHIFVINSIYAEVYVPQIFFLFLALQLWLMNRPILAGLSFSLSTLITPTTVLAVPLLILLRPRKRALLLFFATMSVLLAVVILPRFQDYVFSDRGLLLATQYPFRPGYAIRKQGLEVVMGPFAYLPFVLSGIWHIARKETRILGVATMVLWLSTLLLVDVTPDVPVHLPTYVLLTIFAGLGFQRFSTTFLERRKREIGSIVGLSLLYIFVLIGAIRMTDTFSHIPMMVPISLLAGLLLFIGTGVLVQRLACDRNRRITVLGLAMVFLTMNGLLVGIETDKLTTRLVAFRNTVLQMSEVAAPGYLVVSKWSQGILFEHYVFRKRYTGYWLEVTWVEQEWGMQRWRNAIVGGREVWLFGEYSPFFSDLRDAGYTIEPFKNIYRARPSS